jgi:hypothetical protein
MVEVSCFRIKLLLNRIAVFSRIFVLWAVIDAADSAKTSIFAALVCSSWSLVEVPRYFFYSLNLLGVAPYFLFWLRYRSGDINTSPLKQAYVSFYGVYFVLHPHDSLFAVLYPTGIMGELACMYWAVKELYGNGVRYLHPVCYLEGTYCFCAYVLNTC